MKIEDVKIKMLVDCRCDEDIGRPFFAKVPITYVDYETQNVTVFGQGMHAPWWVPIGDVSFVDESPKEVPPKDTMSDESLKIEDLRIGMLVDCVDGGDYGNPALTGIPIGIISGYDNTVRLSSYWVRVSDLRRHVPARDATIRRNCVPVEEPASTTDPIKAIADRTVLTFRDRLIIAIASGVSTTDAVTFTDRIIAEMAKVKS